jgi:hypothetical protein
MDEIPGSATDHNPSQDTICFNLPLSRRAILCRDFQGITHMNV